MTQQQNARDTAPLRQMICLILQYQTRTTEWFDTFFLQFTKKYKISVHAINRGYYTVARRYEFYVRVARTISHERAQRTSEILLLPRVT